MPPRQDFHIEFWITPDEAQRITINAACWSQAQQICIGRYAPIFLRRLDAA